MRKYLIGLLATAIALPALALSSSDVRADAVTSYGLFFRHLDQTLCGEVTIRWNEPQYGGIPYAELIASRRTRECGQVIGGVAGGLDNWIHLIQENSVYGLIECGGRRVRTDSHVSVERAFNWNNCPTGQTWVARSSVGGQLYDQYFQPGTKWKNSLRVFK